MSQVKKISRENVEKHEWKNMSSFLQLQILSE